MDHPRIQGPAQQIGFSTSIEIAQKQTYDACSVLGTKRPYVQLKPKCPSAGDDRVLTEVTNIASKRSDFKRPCIGFPTERRIKASRIHGVTTAESKFPHVSEYTQRRALPCTPGPSQNPLLSLSNPRYGLPEHLVRNFASLGINSIYPWQSSCLLGRGLLSGERNLVYTAPTGGGKSLVADILMLKKVIEDSRKKAILVLPYVALVQEKLKWLRRAVEGVSKNVTLPDHTLDRSRRWRHDHTSVRVVGFFGGSKARATWSDVDIAVCTIEKANALVNTAIEECSADDLGIVVLDELHMIDDDHRGYLMELMATKLLSLQQGVQIIGMSATLSNTEILAKWLDAKYYQFKYRPVPVEEYLVYDHSIYPASTSSAYFKTASQLSATQPKCSVYPIRAIQPSEYTELKKPVTNAVVSLAIETVEAGYAALVFCSARQGCQATALMLSEAMPSREGSTGDILDRRKEVLSDLRSLSVGLDDTLEKTIIHGVAFHHAGLTTEEREIVAEAYDRGTIKVIVATCSLAAGINLPARRVILQGARMGRDLIGPAMLRQMRGRAGRKGKDEIGESYLCCEKKDLEEVAQLLEADLPVVESCLTPQKRGIKRALLEVLAIRLATHASAINDYISRTLLYHTMDRVVLNGMVETTIQELINTSLITVDSTGSYEATLLGQAIVVSSLTPEDGIFVHEELQRALQAFVMDGEMHIFYMFTPVQSAGLGEINWPIFRREMDGLDESGLRVLKFVGINPGFVNRMANSSQTLPERTLEEKNTARIYRRFYAAFHLRDLCNELPIHAVARKYETPRGFVQNLAQTCEGFAAGMVKFCDRMGMGMLRSVLDHMSDRLKAGAKADLLELANIPFVKSRTARVFWENGMRSLRAVAEASPTDIVPILLVAQPKKSKIDGDEEEKYRQKLRLKADVIVSAANRLWGESEALTSRLADQCTDGERSKERQQQIEIEDDI